MQNGRTGRSSGPTRGLTLIESLCVLSILTTTIGLAMPSLKKWQERQTLLSAAAELETDIQYARSQAVAHSAAVHLAVLTGSEGGCYVMYMGEADGCTCTVDKGAACTGGGAEVLRYSAYPERGVVQLINRNTALTFHPRLGTVTPAATIKLKAPSATIHQIVSIMGRTRSCSPDRMPGIRAC